MAIIRAFEGSVDDVNRAERTLVARINTAGVDRYHTVIAPGGGRFEAYRKNPAVLWEHGRDPRRHTDPIGTNLWIRNNGGRRPTELLARTRFLGDAFAQQRFEWYRDGVLNAFSVNILPDEDRCGPPTRDELRAAPEWETAAVVYRDWELAEYSGTVVPGNADCLVMERAAQFTRLQARGLLWLPEEVLPMIERYIKHNADTGKWDVHSESGRVLGSHDTREEALKQLAAVEASKAREKEKDRDKEKREGRAARPPARDERRPRKDVEEEDEEDDDEEDEEADEEVDDEEEERKEREDEEGTTARRERRRKDEAAGGRPRRKPRRGGIGGASIERFMRERQELLDAVRAEVTAAINLYWYGRIS